MSLYKIMTISIFIGICVGINVHYGNYGTSAGIATMAIVALFCTLLEKK